MSKSPYIVYYTRTVTEKVKVKINATDGETAEELVSSGYGDPDEVIERTIEDTSDWSWECNYAGASYGL